MLPPPVIYFVVFVVGIGLGYMWPTSIMTQFWGQTIGIALLMISMPIMPSVLIRFKRAGTTFDVRKSATTLITDGPYKYSRNPTYISLTLLYLGLGVFLNNMWVLMLVVPLLLIINFWIIRNEEHYLAEKFGEEYQSYRSKVRRWL
jgi:protein-S-isoprenylcysteine O-methyltransferase Ste14